MERGPASTGDGREDKGSPRKVEASRINTGDQHN